MRVYFYAFSKDPTPHRLEPSLEEVFHDPEAYAPYFKPMLAVDLSEIIPGMTGEVFFLYTTCLEEVTFRQREGRYEIVHYDSEAMKYVPDADWVDGLDLESIELPEEGGIGDLKIDDPIDPHTGLGRYLQLYPCDMKIDAQASIIGQPVVRELERMLEAKRVYLRFREGHFGGRPQWMQWVDERDYTDEVFVGQFQTFFWGDFFSCTIYLHLFEQEGDRLLHFTYQST